MEKFGIEDGLFALSEAQHMDDMVLIDANLID